MDGSDEPGTSACAARVAQTSSEQQGTTSSVTKFFCSNIGARSLSLPLSRVDDGVCDCCDGSDELVTRSHVLCPNTCMEAGRAAREALEASIKAHEAGAQAKASLIEAAKQAREKKQATKEKYERLLATRKEALEKAKIIKDEQEILEKIEKEKREAERKAAEGVTEPAVAADTAADAATAVPDVPVTPSDPASAPAPVVASDSAPPSSDPSINFPYPAEYAYHADSTDAESAQAEAEAAATADAIASRSDSTADGNAFPYPAEYAYNPDQPSEDEEDGETVTPQYVDDGEHVEGLGEEPHAHLPAEEDQFIHKGQYRKQ